MPLECISLWPCHMYWVVYQNLYQSDEKKCGEQKPRCRRSTGQFHGVPWWNPGALWELLWGMKCNIQPSTPLIFIDLPWIAINTTSFAGIFFASHTQEVRYNTQLFSATPSVASKAPKNPTMHSGTNGKRKPQINRILKSDTGTTSVVHYWTYSHFLP